jgi:hypothetical protein
MPKALVFATQATADTAQQRILAEWKSLYADWLDANGNVVGANAATDLPAVRAARTLQWAVPMQRADTGEWWIPAPPRQVLANLKTQLQNAGATLQDIQDSWTATVIL